MFWLALGSIPGAVKVVVDSKRVLPAAGGDALTLSLVGLQLDPIVRERYPIMYRKVTVKLELAAIAPFGRIRIWVMAASMPKPLGTGT